MVVMRSKRPLTVGDRVQRDAVIAVCISEVVLEPKLNRYRLLMTDYEVKDLEQPVIGGIVKRYIPISNYTKYKTREEMDALFSSLNVTIAPADSFTTKFIDMQHQGLLLDTQQELIYGSVVEDWELIETDNESSFV